MSWQHEKGCSLPTGLKVNWSSYGPLGVADMALKKKPQYYWAISVYTIFFSKIFWNLCKSTNIQICFKQMHQHCNNTVRMNIGNFTKYQHGGIFFFSFFTNNHQDIIIKKLQARIKRSRTVWFRRMHRFTVIQHLTTGKYKTCAILQYG